MKKIIIKSDGADWVLGQIKSEIKANYSNSNFKFVNFNLLNIFFSRDILFLSKYDFLKIPSWLFKKIYLCLFHIENDKLLKKKIINKIKKNKKKLIVIVSNSKVYQLLIQKGVDPKIIKIIPISFDRNFFYKITKSKILKIKSKLNIPANLKLIGSFQKDGNGWGKGSTPKIIKDPDTFLNAIKLINKTSNIGVILSGPSRGYMINNLNKIGVKYYYFKNLKFKNLNLLYNIIDLYLITSIEEGGPRALLEAMATETPVISTNVGQVGDIIGGNLNELIVKIGDFKSIYSISQQLFCNAIYYQKISNQLGLISKNYDYSSLKDKWFKIFNN